MIGIDQAGKTSILYRMKFGKKMNTVSGAGFNVETFRAKNFYNFHWNYFDFDLWDVGGSTENRAFWKYYYKGIQGIVFVVDASQKERIDEAAEVLGSVLSDDNTLGVRLLVLANKMDLPGTMRKHEISAKLKLKDITNRSVAFLEFSAVNGKGITQFLEWFHPGYKQLV